MKNHLFSMSLMLLMILVFSHQTHAQTTTVTTKPNDENIWNPAKVSNDGTNIINGVEFYKKAVKTLTHSVELLKVVNTNAYTVKIQWEESAGVKKEIIVAANTTVEGNDDSVNKDSNESKLVFWGKLSDEAKKLIRSTISVTQVQ